MPKFAVYYRREPRPKAPARSTHIHALWEMDSKENVRLGDSTIATVLDVREPLACCFLGSFAHAVQTEKAWRKLVVCQESYSWFV